MAGGFIMEFTPCENLEKSPERIDQLDEVESPNRVNLRDVPLGTIIEFYGEHPDSKYIAKIVGPEDNRKIKIWFKGNDFCAIGSIDSIISAERLLLPPQEGVMQIGYYYALPHFYFKWNENKITELIINPMVRTEKYTKIFVKKHS